MTREDLIKMARATVERTTDVHEYHGIPASFDPHEWVLEAMQSAYNRGVRDGARAAGSSLYPEGG